MPQPDLTGIAVVVVNYGSSALLAANLAPLSRADTGLTVVVVDNRTDDAEAAAIAALGEREGWRVVLSPTNLGFGDGMNAGVVEARSAGARWFLLLNPDATIDAESVALLRDRLVQAPDALVAPRIVRPDGSMWSEGSDLYLADGRIRSRRRRVQGAPVREWLTGACLLIGADLWDRIGGFDPAYFLYWEDVDLSWKVVEAGGRLEIVADATAVHDEGGTHGADSHASAGAPKSATYYYYNIRNRIVFARLRLDPAAQRSWRRHTLRVSYEILLQGGKRQFAHPSRNLLPALRALRDASRLPLPTPAPPDSGHPA